MLMYIEIHIHYINILHLQSMGAGGSRRDEGDSQAAAVEEDASVTSPNASTPCVSLAPSLRQVAQVLCCYDLGLRAFSANSETA